jgi:hypothetical protein
MDHRKLANPDRNARQKPAGTIRVTWGFHLPMKLNDFPNDVVVIEFLGTELDGVAGGNGFQYVHH